MLRHFSLKDYEEFTMTHRETIAAYLATVPDPKQSPQTIKAFVRPHLDDHQYAKGSKELDRLLDNLPSVLQVMDYDRSRGFRR